MTGSAARRPVFGVSLIGGAAAWAAFLSYGDGAGRYPAWQFVGAGVGVVVATLISRGVAHGRGRRVATILGVTIGFTACWTWWAGRDDPTGLYAVGAVLVATLLLASTTVLTLVSDAIVDLTSSRRRRGKPVA